LEDGLGTTITTLSLPGGRANRSVLAACEQAGYTTVWTSEPRAESLLLGSESLLLGSESLLLGSESLPQGSSIGRFNIRGDVRVEWLRSLLTPESGVLAGVHRMHTVKAVSKHVLGDRLYARLWSVLNRQETESEPTAVEHGGENA
jgi:hypothetical protein